MFTEYCNGRATCNCAIAVRVGRDVFIVDKCNPTYTRKKMFRCTDNAMTVKETGRDTYEVT